MFLGLVLLIVTRLYKFCTTVLIVVLIKSSLGRSLSFFSVRS